MDQTFTIKYINGPLMIMIFQGGGAVGPNDYSTTWEGERGGGGSIDYIQKG